MHVQRSVKSVRRAQQCTTLKEFRGCERSFAPHGTRGYGSFSRRPHALFATLGAAGLSYSSFLMGTSRCCGCIYALCLLFRFRARLLALSFSLPSPFCCHNNEPASTATALRTINLHKCKQTFVNRSFNCIPKWDGCLCTSHTFNCILKRDTIPHQQRTRTARLVALR